MRRKNKSALQFGFVAILIMGLSVGVTLVTRVTRLGSKAAAPVCDNVLTISVSKDGSNFPDNKKIDLPSGTPTKYYVKTFKNGAACSSNFDVYYRNCDGSGNNCGAWQSKFWGTYRSNINGILRADLDSPWPDHLTVQMKLRPAGRTDIQWSNQADIRFTGNTTNTPVPDYMQDMKNYIKMVPGWTYIYNSQNNISGGQTGLTRLQIEQQITKCGINIFPWRFTKNSRYVYWGHVISNLSDGQRDLRWFITDPGFNYTQQPSYNNYIWGLGDSNYGRWSGDAGILDPIRDIRVNSIINSHTYRSAADAGGIPSYNLSPEYIYNFPYINYLNGKTSSINQSGALTNCQLVGGTGTGSWKIRIEKDNVNINNGPDLYNYSGEAVRVDYYEGKNPLETNDSLRESWYYVKDTGLVKIVSKLFNNYGESGVRNCRDDSDCWDDTIRNPDFTAILKQIFKNPTLSVLVSADGSNYSASINTTQATGYWLKVSPAYTGYLESRLYANGAWGTLKRWLWVENGIARVPNPGSIYNWISQFRVWIPNELGPGETAGPNQVSLPWSNTATINVTGAGGATCTDGTWKTSPNYSGNNWCPVNNKLCVTDWISDPRVPITCGVQKLQNKGTYCTKSNGTKSFVGFSSCVD